MTKQVQDQMDLFMGKAPNVNAYNQIANLMFLPKFETVVADLTLLSMDSGTIYVTTGATATVNFTLPAITDGPWIFLIVSGAATGVTVTAETADTLVAFNDLTADSVSFDTTSEIIGGAILAFSDGTSAFAVPMGASHAQTLTVAT